MFTTDVENYPGFPEKVTGQDLMQRFRDQAHHQGTEIITADVSKVDLSKPPFKIWVGDEKEPTLSRTVIIATGARANYLGLPSEDKLKNKGVSACAVCDGPLFRGETVAVVGGGDTAMEEASYLAGLCSHVTLIHRRDEFRASKAMQDRVFANPKIEVLFSHEVRDVGDVAKDRVTSVEVEESKDRQARRRCRSRRSSSPSATPRCPSSSSVRSTFTPTGTSRPCPERPRPRFPACLPVATCKTGFSGRRLPLPVPDAWQLSRPSVTWGRSGAIERQSPREELARLAEELRVHAEWQVETGATGVPRREEYPTRGGAGYAREYRDECGERGGGGDAPGMRRRAWGRARVGHGHGHGHGCEEEPDGGGREGSVGAACRRGESLHEVSASRGKDADRFRARQSGGGALLHW